MKPTTDELREWRSLELTRRVMLLVKEERSDWTEKSCMSFTSAEESHRLAALRDGVIAGLRFILDLGVDEDDTGTGKSQG